MNENQVFKEHLGVMSVDIHNDDVDVTKATVYSFDYDTGKFTYKLEKNGEPINLANATKINVALSFGDEGQAVLNATTVDKINSIISFVYPEQYLSYSGRVLGEVSIQYSNGQSLVAGYFSFNVKGAEIDSDSEWKHKFYVEKFEDLDSLITNQSKEIDKSVGDMQVKVDDINQKIEENDLVTKPEAGNFEDFREQDKSLIEKMKNENQERGINVRWFGAIGDGVVDDTVSIQNAIDFAKQFNFSKIICPDGIYMIKSHVDNSTSPNYLKNEGGVLLHSGITLELSDNCILRAIPNNQKAYNILRTYNSIGVSIVGGTVEGELDKHTGTTGEWGYCIAIQGGGDVIIKDTEFTNAWGDGINIQVNQEGTGPIGVLIKNVKSHKNGRQGMSVEAGDKIKCIDSEFLTSERTSPKTGVDIEPSNSNNQVGTIEFIRCKFSKNGSYGLMCHASNLVEPNIKKIILDSCYASKNNSSEKMALNFSNAKEVIVKNTHLKDGGITITNSRKVTLKNVTIENGALVIRKTGTYPMSINISDVEINISKPIDTTLTVIDKGYEVEKLFIDRLKIFDEGLLAEKNLIDKTGNITNVRALKISNSEIFGGKNGFEAKKNHYVSIRKSIFDGAEIMGARLEENINLTLKDNDFDSVNSNNENGQAVAIQPSKDSIKYEISGNNVSNEGMFKNSDYKNTSAFLWLKGDFRNAPIINYHSNTGISDYYTKFLDGNPKNQVTLNSNNSIVVQNVNQLPENSATGLIAYVVMESKYYFSNNNKKWVEF